jgi:hypothetical protein
MNIRADLHSVAQTANNVLHKRGTHESETKSKSLYLSTPPVLNLILRPGAPVFA